MLLLMCYLISLSRATEKADGDIVQEEDGTKK